MWRDADKAAQAAEAMGITAPRLKELGLIDAIIEEPMGGAHRNFEQTAQNIKAVLLAQLADLDALDPDNLIERRYQRLLSYGYC